MTSHRSDTIKAIHEAISTMDSDEPFYIMNTDALEEQVRRWSCALPSVKPFYAVKCNPNQELLNTMIAKYDFGFECASLGEIRMMLDAGATIQDIIYCNPCKQRSHLIQAYGLGIRIMSFDNHDELKKIAEYCPDAQLILRIWVDDSESGFKLSQKFGANEEYSGDLLEEAKKLNMNVCGISFHVGSYCSSPKAFTNALTEAKKLLDVASGLEFVMKILDIGGGFQSGTLFEECAYHINQSLEMIREDFPDLSVIAEPGRFFCEPVFTLVTQVVSRKEDQGIQMYYINDGVYGSFNCSLYDCPIPVPVPLDPKNAGVTLPSCIWGPTCDSYDCVVKRCDLPLLEIGDWIYFEDMGAYSMSLTCPFNGFEAAKIFNISS